MSALPLRRSFTAINVKVRNFTFPTDLINPKSAISGSKPVMKETSIGTPPLDKHEGWLRQWILEDQKNGVPMCTDSKKLVDMGLQPRAVSRDLDWGILYRLKVQREKYFMYGSMHPSDIFQNTKELLPDTWETW